MDPRIGLWTLKTMVCGLVEAAGQGLKYITCTQVNKHILIQYYYSFNCSFINILNKLINFI